MFPILDQIHGLMIDNEAIKPLRASRPNMTMTGEKLVASLMTVRPDIPVVLCTGFSEQITEHRTFF